MSQHLGIDKCKHCGCTEFYEQEKSIHIGIYCKACNTWQKWKKQTAGVEEDKQLATQEQKAYIYNLMKGKLTKAKASKLIALLKEWGYADT